MRSKIFKLDKYEKYSKSSEGGLSLLDELSNDIVNAKNELDLNAQDVLVGYFKNWLVAMRGQLEILQKKVEDKIGDSKQAKGLFEPHNKLLAAYQQRAAGLVDSVKRKNAELKSETQNQLVLVTQKLREAESKANKAAREANRATSSAAKSVNAKEASEEAKTTALTAKKNAETAKKEAEEAFVALQKEKNDIVKANEAELKIKNIEYDKLVEEYNNLVKKMNTSKTEGETTVASLGKKNKQATDKLEAKVTDLATKLALEEANVVSIRRQLAEAQENVQAQTMFTDQELDANLKLSGKVDTLEASLQKTKEERDAAAAAKDDLSAEVAGLIKKFENAQRELERSRDRSEDAENRGFIMIIATRNPKDSPTHIMVCVPRQVRSRFDDGLGTLIVRVERMQSWEFPTSRIAKGIEPLSLTIVKRQKSPRFVLLNRSSGKLVDPNGDEDELRALITPQSGSWLTPRLFQQGGGLGVGYNCGVRGGQHTPVISSFFIAG